MTKRFLSHIIALALVFVTIIRVMAVPSYALSVSGLLGDYVIGKGIDAYADIIKTLANNGKLDDSNCIYKTLKAVGFLKDGESIQWGGGSGNGGGAGLAISGGDRDGTAVTDDDINTAYNSYVTNLNTTYNTNIFNSDGGFVIKAICDLSPTSGSDDYKIWPWTSTTYTATLLFKSLESHSHGYSGYPIYFHVLLPVTGSYYVYFNNPFYETSYTGSSSNLLDSSNHSNYTSLPITGGNHVSSSIVYINSTIVSTGTYGLMILTGNKVLSLNESLSATFGPIYFVYKSSTPVLDNSTRIDSISLSGSSSYYGYYGDDGTLQVDNSQTKIFDSTTNNFYMPSTGTTYSANNWTYDYSDKSYDVTLASNDQGYSGATVSYGDDKIVVTLTKSDGTTTTQNYYYVVPSTTTSEVSPSPSASATVSPTTSEAVTPSPSSSVVVSPSPSDSSGNTQDSSWWHNILSALSTAIGGLFEAIGTLIESLLAGLISLATKVVDGLGSLGSLFSSLIKSACEIFKGFLSFLSYVFPFLPAEVSALIELGVVLMIGAAVLRKFLT